MTTRQTLRERFGPRVMRTSEYIGSNVFVTTIIQIVLAAVIAGLAISRANGHRLSAIALLVLLGVSPFLNAGVVSILGLFGGLVETVEGRVQPDDGAAPQPVGGDPLSPRRFWRKALERGIVAGAWGTGLGVLVVAALNRRQAGYLIVFVGTLAAISVSSALMNLASQVEGVRIGQGGLSSAAPRATRSRAWRDLALPFAILLGISNAGFSWVLFHDYTVGAMIGRHVLTEQEVLADLPILALLSVGIAAYACGRAGRAEARLGLVTFEDPDTQLPPPRSLHGPQGLVYAVIATFLLSSLVKFLLPALPNLAEAMIARGFLSAFLVFVAGGFAYIRGAANATASGSIVELKKVRA